MHLMFARGLGHLVVIPIGGLLAMMWAHLDIAWMVSLDVAAVLILEMALVGGPVALAVAIKSLPLAVAGAYILPKILPRPTVTAAIVSTLIVAATVAGFAWYVIRSRRTLNRPDLWYRTVASLACLAAAATIEVSVAGLALTMGGFTASHLAAALSTAPLWIAAYTFQTPPRRGGSRSRWSPMGPGGRAPWTVLTRGRDKVAQTAMAGGVH